MNIRIFGTIIILSMVGCNLLYEQPPPSIDDPRIVQSATERLQRYIDQKQESCYNRVNSDAEVHVDTTITNLIDRFLTDGVQFPSKPPKPSLPPRIELDTSLIPVPIFKDSLSLAPIRRKDTTILSVDTTGQIK